MEEFKSRNPFFWVMDIAVILDTWKEVEYPAVKGIHSDVIARHFIHQFKELTKKELYFVG